MRTIRVGAAQFEAADGDKEFNFSRIETLAHEAVAEGETAMFRQAVSVKGGRVMHESFYRGTKRTVPPEEYAQLIDAQELMMKQAEAVWTFEGVK